MRRTFLFIEEVIEAKLLKESLESHKNDNIFIMTLELPLKYLQYF